MTPETQDAVYNIPPSSDFQSLFQCLRPCPECGQKLHTNGRGYFRCPGCGYTDTQELEPLKTTNKKLVRKPTRKPIRQKQELPDNIRQNAIDLRLAGVRVKEIARRLKVPEYRLYEVFKTVGLSKKSLKKYRIKHTIVLYEIVEARTAQEAEIMSKLELPESGEHRIKVERLEEQKKSEGNK